MRHINQYNVFPTGYHKQQGGAEAIWVSTNTNAYPTTTAWLAGWQTLDLSGVIGRRATWAYISPGGGATISDVAVRRTGDVYNVQSAALAWGRPGLLVETDSNGCAEFWCNINGTSAIYVVGYVKDVSIMSPPVSLASGVVPVGWSTLDASAKIKDRSIALINDHYNAVAAGARLYKAYGDAADWLLPDGSDWAFANRSRDGALNLDVRLITLTGSAGEIDVYSAGAFDITTSLQSYVSEGSGLYIPAPGTERIYSNAAMPWNGTATIDASGLVGAKRALMFLKVDYAANTGASVMAIYADGATFPSTSLYGGCEFRKTVNKTGRATIIVAETSAAGRLFVWVYNNSFLALPLYIDVLGYIPAL